VTAGSQIGLPTLPASAEARAVVAHARRLGRPRALVVALALALATFAALCVSVSLGDYPVPLADVVPAMVGAGDPSHTFVVQELRLPRALCGLLVGLALGMSGAVFQTLAANELASPDVIGITEGASAAAVVVVVVLGASATSLSLAALAGGLITAALIYLLAYRRGVSGYRLILVGIGIAAGLSALTEYLLTRARIEEVQRAAVWLTGSLTGRDWSQVTVLAIACAALVPAVLLLARGLRTLQLGDQTAKGVGLRVEPVRAAVAFAAVGLCAFATAAAGPVAFVAFVAAPIARRLVGGGHLALVQSALVGALLLTCADLLAREAFGSIQLPVGVLTGAIGAPYLLWLLTRTNRLGTGD
jgi:iron complex transport system permease protein